MKYNLFLWITISCSFFSFSQEEELKIADSLYSFGKQTRAIELLNNIETKNDKVHLKLARFNKNSGFNQRSLEHYKTVLQENPEKILASIEFGELLLETKNYEKADSLFSLLSEKYPDNASLTYRLALAREEQKDSTAMDLYFKTVGLDSTHQGALYKTAKFELMRGNRHNAIRLSQTGLRTRPENASLLSILGQAYLASLQFEASTVPFEKLIELGEGSEFILEKLASAYRRSSQTDKAIITYEKLLEIDNMNGAVHTNLGALYLKKNNTEKAHEHFMMALFIKNRPADSEYVNLGLSYKRKEDHRSAYISFQKALEENPENERAMIELALAADAHFEDKETVLKLYQDFVDKYQKTGRNDMLSIAEYRISELKKEIHLAK